MKKGLLFTGLIVALTLICCYALVAKEGVITKQLVPVADKPQKATPVYAAPTQSKADLQATSSMTNEVDPRIEDLRVRIDDLKARGLYDAALWAEYFNLVGPSHGVTGHLDQGGDNCASAVVLSGALPITTTGTTVGYTDDYEESLVFACPYGSTSGDVVYKYTPTANDTVNIDLCASLYDTKLMVYAEVSPSTDCASLTLVACDDDGCPGGTYRSLVECLPVDYGYDYYIVIDGYGGDEGDYELTISECVVEEPVVEECPEGSLFSQPPGPPDLGLSAGTSDLDPAYPIDYTRADNFSGVCENICEITFWGINAVFDGAAWQDCLNEDPMTFEIIFYYDASGFAGPGMWTLPGAAACTYTVTVARDTAAFMHGSRYLWRYTAALSPCCPMSAGWVSIQGISIGTPTNCWFLWESSGDPVLGYSAFDDGGGWGPDDQDMSFCLNGTGANGAIGACCNPETGDCFDDVDCADCEYDFYWNMDCADIFPPCGATLCEASGGDYEYIANIEIGDCFANPSTYTVGYDDYFFEDPPGCATLYTGQANPITVTLGSPYDTDIGGLWIDWNNDFDFYGVGETIYDETSWMGLGPYMGTITPPAGTEGGTYRMRVRIQDGYYDPVVDPCGVSTYGEVEDYCVYVCGLEPPIIEVPTGGPGPAYHFAETVNTCGYCAYVPTGHMGEFGDGCWYYYIYMGPSVLYMLHTYEVGTITVTTTGDDPAMFIFTDLCDPFNTCVAGSDWTGGNPSTETCVLTDLAPGVYYINVALWDDGSGRCGDIDLDITGDVQLPVELTSFEAIAGNNEVALTWTTAAELNNDYFEVQRSTNSEWTTLGTVDGTNDANGSSYNYTDRSVVNGVTYTYRLLSHDINGAVNEYEMTAEATPQAPLPTEYALGQNYPNPFNPTTTITYALKDAGFVTLKVYNLLGQEVANLVSEQLNPGSYTANFNATNLPSGIYVYRLEVNDFTAQQKMVLLK